ncbi:adenylate/guanylate cyclase domain-containing protein [Rhizobium grahamii]|uniref:Putative adenylate/guanylate cyclase n=1 Tax=Rhizobium grahamii CCGE 502 TaxID=990285 RepID=S3HP84_9HYPH|nr:adenylate/guanylate cyclase domain-containing protein [Rhizobium grahamii]EPE95176.1 putative adenylate/guanylate cyclase [Rhizobium grahamii CCGE 502]
MSNWSKPLRVHLSVVIVGLLICISTPLMWMAYEQGRATALAAGETQMRQLGLRVVENYQNVFGDGYSAAATASVLPQMLTPPSRDFDAKRDYLLKVLQSADYIDGIYAGYPDGSFIQAVNVAANLAWREVLSAPEETAFAIRVIDKSPAEQSARWHFLGANGVQIEQRNDPGDPYDPRTRSWYQTARDTRQQVSVGPYVTATTKSLSLTLAVPMTRDHETVAGVDVLLQTISRLLNKEAISENARGYVFDGRGRLIVHSDAAVMARILQTLSRGDSGDASVPDDADPAIVPIRALLSAHKGTGGGIVPFNVNGISYVAQISPVEFSGLLKGNAVVIAAPLADLVGPTDRLLFKNLMIAAAFVAVGIAAAIVMARLISKSLFALADEARSIGDLKFEGRRLPHSWIAEINILARTLEAARNTIATFSLYVPRELVRRIVTSGQAAIGLAGRQEITVLFTDIQDFTTISEQHSPEEVVELLSTYFELLNETVEQHDGTIVQYLGDSIFGMWNAPTRDEHHVAKACRCALAMKQAIDGMNSANRQAGRPQLVTRFGLHTGQAVVGSVGAKARRQYTAMGDTVNVGSRLEGMNKEFGTSVLASGAVRAAVSELFEFRALGTARAKGRMEELLVYELVGSSRMPSSPC